MFDSRNGCSSVVYFAVADKIKHVKIGVTTNPQARLTSIQNGCPVEVDIRGTVLGTVADEAVLHATFAEYRARGEWFRVAGDIADLLNGLRFRRGYRCVVDGGVKLISDATEAELRKLIDVHVEAFSKEAHRNHPKVPTLNCHMTIALLAAKELSTATGTAEEVHFSAVLAYRFQPPLDFLIADPRRFDVVEVVRAVDVLRHANATRHAVRMSPVEKPNHDEPDVAFSLTSQPYVDEDAA